MNKETELISLILFNQIFMHFVLGFVSLFCISFFFLFIARKKLDYIVLAILTTIIVCVMGYVSMIIQIQEPTPPYVVGTVIGTVLGVFAGRKLYE